MNPENASIMTYTCLVAYLILHQIFVIAGCFIIAFDIPPLNIGIYVGKLVSLRSLLMFISSIIEWVITQKCYSKDNKARVVGALLWFMAMLVCRITYLYLVYYSDNKSLDVFIVLCIEGFWFGMFQMGFFAIGPEYNAFTSLALHTSGNFIFFFQLILDYYGKTKPWLDDLAKVQAQTLITVVSTTTAFVPWGWLMIFEEKEIGYYHLDSISSYSSSRSTSSASGNNVAWHNAVSPFLLFPVGSAIKDFLYPGILPFAFLYPYESTLINYTMPLFYMIGPVFIILVNDVFNGGKGLVKELVHLKKRDSKFKEWSEGTGGEWWHTVWLGLIAMVAVYVISLFTIHGIYPNLRFIVISRTTVFLMTLVVLVSNSFFEVMSYVGVANYAKKSEKYDILSGHNFFAIFCRFWNARLSVGYNWTRITLGYCLPKFRPRHRGFGFGFWWWVGRTLARAWADTCKDFKADIKDYL